MKQSDVAIPLVEYDGEEGITPHGRKLIIYVNGEEREVLPVFYDPIKGYIQTETAFYAPKEEE